MLAFQENAGRCRRPGQSTTVTSSSTAYSSTGSWTMVASDSRDVSAYDKPWTEKFCMPDSGTYSHWSSGAYISPESSVEHHSGITMKISVNRPLGHLLCMQLEFDSGPHGAGRITFKIQINMRQCTWMAPTPPDVERTGLQMVFQGILTLWLSTADTLHQPCISAYGHW